MFTVEKGGHNFAITPCRHWSLDQGGSSGRQVEQMPDLTDEVDTFSEEWWAWWALLLKGRLTEFSQPSADVPAPTLADVQQEVMKGGANGVFLLLLSLAWWGLAARNQGAARVSAWEYAFHDFTMVLNVMHDHLCTTSSAGKHPGDELEDSRRKRARLVLLLQYVYSGI